MEKTCEHPGCEEVFTPKSKKDRSKYCLLHKQQKFVNRRYLIRENYVKREDIIIPNILYQIEIDRRCKLCGALYKTNAYPNKPINSEFCELHRNPYQQGRYLLTHDTPYYCDQPKIPNHVELAKKEFFSRLKAKIEQADMFDTNELDVMISRSKDIFPFNAIPASYAIKTLPAKGTVINMITMNGWIEKIHSKLFQSIIGD